MVLNMIRIFLFCLILFFFLRTTAQEKLPYPSIHSIKLYKQGDQTSFPIINLGSSDVLELHFDDLDGDVKNYYYGFQLYNADWTPSMLHPFEYTKGFQNVRITNYRTSSIALTRYTHYQATVPDRNCYPTVSGNYLLKVFLNGDTSKTVFTHRFVVADNKASIAAQLQQPYTSQFFKTHQKLQVAVTTDNRIRLMSPQDLKVLVLQNKNWHTSFLIDRPTVNRGNYLEYNDEAITAVPAGREWRWIDLRSFRLLSDRVQRIDARGDSTHVIVKPDASRTGQAYIFYRDLNGSYTMETLENINPFWQSDYAYVHFRYFPADNRPFEGREVYVFGELTRYATDTSGRMTFNPELGAYEKTLLLKQGYYNYEYITLPVGKLNAYPDFSVTEGNYWGTENSYTIIIYYRSFGARADEILGAYSINSIFQRQ
ncbi:MAG: DUF5103 domain-containing protein [Flavisolibacter sp.]|nr:DUF5103 domain-containing protein [Flavisolibacter sp.]